MNSKRAVVEITNYQRHQNHLPPLRTSRVLNLSAQAKANLLARNQRLEHGRWWKLIYKFAGKRYNGIGENIASGQTNAQEVTHQWYNSPEHKDNILGEYEDIGVGNRGTYWVQHFGRRATRR